MVKNDGTAARGALINGDYRLAHDDTPLSLSLNDG
jgi:hypothetical protein